MAVSLLFDALKERERTDRRMNFWIWLIISFLTLGIGFIIAFYFLIKRTRDHFRRQRRLEMGIIELLRSRGIDEQTLRQLQEIHEEAKHKEKEKNPVLWAILLLIPFVALRTCHTYWRHWGSYCMTKKVYENCIGRVKSTWHFPSWGDASYFKTQSCTIHYLSNSHTEIFRYNLDIFTF